ncbi:hypothetical protein QCN29_05070 [Streptomyces sp. HNM0663]|uniref:Uncharacterized protein n=1 Tax=Streptomyces chengmaiensis TaxID=3040919 RepID=A0ABT6HHF3_9ACTN|nr:hypothetical protein [Streptomyces chengmaiensis]MDH2388170.1 hypothetical protein [Streptomyces chengmaiensis]
MRMYIGEQEAVGAAFEFDEPAWGFAPPLPEDFRHLFLGESGESGEERAARLSVARAVLAELLQERDADDVSRLNARYARQLMNTVPFQSKSKAVARWKPWRKAA